MDVNVLVDVVKVDVNVLEHVEIAETVQHVHVVLWIAHVEDLTIIN